jgi:hypothetical protein
MDTAKIAAGGRFPINAFEMGKMMGHFKAILTEGGINKHDPHHIAL